MRILFIVIILAALGVGGYAVYKEEYVIAFAMVFVIFLQVVNLLGAKKRKKR
ncbi:MULTISPECIES: hypothetical protein [Bacteroidaceae]|uniref:hypothetical protein n=1 Tax=Bacteroidaceae TaxID=815 RepID=UPI0003395B9A|nr:MULTISPECIES: hypothetical protein [Bacteroidaceae]MCL1608523.1 hypothetical protein [Mediterranea sp. ET5]MDM8123412.1 hypothetical protein [Mediterranea massiliensis]MDM8199520.1 hypothetical protein [Mediterranea massiliensis]CDD82389.1 unknown [Bacteroides sp. CAG:462]